MNYFKKIYYQFFDQVKFNKNPNKVNKYKVFRKIKIKGKDVLILTAFNENYDKIANHSVKSIKKYSNFFKFRFQIDKIPKSYNKAAAWYKVDMILKALEKNKNKIIVWIDSDALFLKKVDLRSELDNFHDLYCVSHDVTIKRSTGYKNIFFNIPRPNTGFLIIKNSTFNLNLFKNLLKKRQYYNSGWWDNSAFLDILELNAEIKNDLNMHRGNLKLLKKIKFLTLDWNSIPSIQNNKLSTESISPIILHFAGYPVDGKIDIYKKFLNDKKLLI